MLQQRMLDSGILAKESTQLVQVLLTAATGSVCRSGRSSYGHPPVPPVLTDQPA
jgi:hypothetical protein